MQPLIINDIAKKYPTFQLLPTSFSLTPGTITGLIGRNGAGKSTLLKAILNLISTDQGTVKVLGKDFITNEAFCKQNLGVVLGGTDFYREKKLRQITAITKRFYPNWEQSTYEHYLQLFELDPNKKIKELSAGMNVKYALTLALSHQAKLLILDEPTSGLDPVSRAKILSIFKILATKKQLTILFSTHITSDLDKCADNILYLKKGYLEKAATKADFLAAYQFLKAPEETTLTLEEIIIRLEVKNDEA